MGRARWYAAVVTCLALLVACGSSPGDETGVVAGTGVLDETALALGSGSAAVGTPTTSVATPVDVAAQTTTTGVGTAGGGATPTTVRRNATTTTAKASTGSGSSTAAADLERLMVVDGPPGYHREEDDDAVTGHIEFEDAVEYDDEDDSEEFFRRHGFEGGWDRAWMRGEYDEEDEDAVLIEVYDTLYRWRDAGGAVAYMDRFAKYIESTDGEDGIKVMRFPVEGIPGARGYAVSHPDYGDWATVLFTKGRHSVDVTSGEETVDKAKDVASSVARDQYGRL